MGFLPTDYKEPVQSNYMDFVEGENSFRVLDSATVGWEYWTEVYVDGEKKNRPVRVGEYESIPLGDVVVNKFGNLNLSFFWAFPVWNFSAQKVQILTVKQKTVRNGMLSYINNKKWGDPTEYTFVVTKGKDESGKTNYTVIAEPKEKLDPKILAKYKALNLDMSVWMAGKDPFAPNQQKEESQAESEASSSEDDLPF